MTELQKATGESTLHFIEMALIVQLTNSDEDISRIVQQILDLRTRRVGSDKKRKFDSQEFEKAAKRCNKAPTTFGDYADTNFRYLRATGLVHSKRRGVSLVAEKQVIIEQLIQDKSIPDSSIAYLQMLCQGASLPTDSKDGAIKVLEDLLVQIKGRNISFDLKGRSLNNAADISIVRHEIEELLLKADEERYADRQIDDWEEIATYIDLIASRRRSGILSNGEEIRVPDTETPAYLEWILWRAFLAIDSLKNKPYEARRFKIDQDFLPIGTAPGNGPDMIFEFEDYVLVVEVTLTENSRQEAVEGESVRRHVANMILSRKTKSHKEVYGLFIAKRIDSITTDTFWSGRYLDPDNNKMQLDIVPVTLEEFKRLFVGLIGRRPVQVSKIREMIDRCISLRSDYDRGPTWKQAITQVVNHYVENLSS